MKVVIDLDLHQAIQDFTIRSAVGPYSFKSQDTVEWELYFVKAGIVQDLGAGFAVKFGMIKTGDTTNTILAYQTTFNYLTDSDGNVYYGGLVNFNTSQMATAIGTAPLMNGTAEIRYQDAISEIIHSLNISCVVYATILVETGVTPPGVSTGYPDASTIELLTHKNQPSGYAGLGTGGKLNGSVIPVDGQTIQINGSGQIASSAILTTTTANFTTPPANGSVTVQCVDVTKLVISQYVRIPIAGFYVVVSFNVGTESAVLQNNGDPFNAASGTTITSGAVLLPAQAAAGGGSSGQAAYTSTIANFTVPNVGSTVQIKVESTSWMGGNGYGMFITGAGYYLIQSIVDANTAVVTNSGSGSNQPSGTVVTSGAQVSAAGPMGPTGAAGAGLSAYDALSASFVMPAMNVAVPIQIANTAWMGMGQVIYIASAGHFQVTSITNATNVSVTNLGYPGAVAPGTTIASGSHVGPAGPIGPQGAGGPGLNAFTTLTTSFIQPAVSSPVIIVVGTTAWMAQGQGIYIAGGGYYSVVSVGDLTHVIITNSGTQGNATVGATVLAGGVVTPAGQPGTVGANAFTLTSASFAVPAIGSNITVSVYDTSWGSQGQTVFVTGAGYYQIASVISSTQFSLTNLGYDGNAASGITVASGSDITPSGPIGPQGIAGAQGAAGRDGAYATIYTDKSLTGNGGVSTQATLVNDLAQGTGAYKVYQRDSLGNGKWDIALLRASDAVAAPVPGEVSLTASQANGNLALKKLKSGPAGSVALTDNGGTTGDVLIDVPVDGTTITVSSGKLTVIGGSGGGTGTLPQESIGAHIESPSAKIYVVDLYASSAYHINAFYAVLGAGTCACSVQQNGGAVTGLNLPTVSTTMTHVTITPYLINAGDKITITVASPSGATDLAFSLLIQR